MLFRSEIGRGLFTVVIKAAATLRKNGMLSGSMTRQLHHMITRAYFTAVCETIVHDMPREEAMKYVDELAIFFHSGWSGLLRLE